MFGILRYALALMVVICHALGPVRGQLSWFGIYAVFAFYALSGFLMTKVLADTYGYSPRGLLSYLGNRFLRIYPLYWVIVALSAALACSDPVAAKLTNPFFKVPPTEISWFYNLALAGLHTHPPFLVPTAWTLSVEVLFYVAMGLVLSRSPVTVAVWLIASVGYAIYAICNGISAGSTLAGSSVAFAMGAAIYFLPVSRCRPPLLLAAIAAFAMHAAFADFLWAHTRIEGLYVSTLLAGLLLIALRGTRTQSQRARRLDALAGDLSYPIFLCHLLVFAGLYAFVFDHKRPPRESMLLYSLPLIHILAFLLHAGITERIEPLRAKLRPKGHRVSRPVHSRGRDSVQVPPLDTRDAVVA